MNQGADSWRLVVPRFVEGPSSWWWPYLRLIPQPNDALSPLSFTAQVSLI
jgi:hypothetical protein